MTDKMPIKLKTYCELISFISIYLLFFILAGGGIIVKLSISSAIFYLLFTLRYHPKIAIHTDPMHPLILTKILLFLGFFLGSLALSWKENIRNDFLILTILMGFIFLVCIDLIAFLLHKNNDWGKSNLNVSQIEKTIQKYNLKTIFIVFYIISWLWRIYALNKGLLHGTFLGTHIKVGSAGNVIGIFNNLGQIFYIGLIIISKSIGFLVLPFELLWGILSGSKSALVYTIFPFLFIGLQKGYIPINRKTIIVGIIGILLFIGSFALIYVYRLESSKFIYAFGTANFSLTKIFSNISLSNVQLDKIYLIFFERINLAQYLYNLLTFMNYENISYWYGKSLTPIFSWYIPRFIWADKFSVSTGLWFAQEAYGWGYRARTEVGMTIWGDGYLNFGLLGSVLIPCFWFIIINLIYIKFIKKSFFMVLLLTSIYLKLLLSIEQNIAVPMVSFMQQSILIAIIYLGFKTRSALKAIDLK